LFLYKYSKKVVKVVIHNNDKYLLQLRNNIPAIYYPNTWTFFRCWCWWRI